MHVIQIVKFKKKGSLEWIYDVLEKSEYFNEDTSKGASYKHLTYVEDSVWDYKSKIGNWLRLYLLENENIKK